jgi:hypothetical protein
MAKVGLKPKKIACYTDEQQKLYESLRPRQRAYVDYRSQGFNKSDSYRKAGYCDSKNVGVNAFTLENKTLGIKDLIETRLKVKRANDIYKADSEIGKQIDALANVENAENALEVVENADAETIKRIKFFRDIVDGKIKTVKKTTYTDKLGNKSTKVEEINDIETRMKARKELDRLLGLNEVFDIGKIETGDITINIVDASKKDAIGDASNKVQFDLTEKEEELDGEVVIIEPKDEDKKPRGRPRAKNVVVDAVNE